MKPFEAIVGHLKREFHFNQIHRTAFVNSALLSQPWQTKKTFYVYMSGDILSISIFTMAQVGPETDVDLNDPDALDIIESFIRDGINYGETFFGHNYVTEP